METFQEAIKPFLYENGAIVQLKVGQTQLEDNIHSFTGDYLTHCILLGIPDYEVYNKYIKYLTGCEVSLGGEIVKGLFKRHPNNFERKISHDEMIGIIQGDISGPDFLFLGMFTSISALHIYKYGKNNFGCWDNRTPNEWTPHGWLYLRFPDYCGYFKVKAGYDLNLWEKLWWTSRVLATRFTPKGNTNGKRLMYLVSEAFDKQGLLCRLANKYFRRYMTKMYGDVSGLYEIYYPKDHPMAIYTKGLKF